MIQSNTYNGKKNNLNILSLEKPVKVVGDLTGSQIGLSDPTLWDDNKEDTAEDAVSTKRLTDGFKTNNASLIPADAFTSDHDSWVVDFGEKYVSPKTTYTYTAQKYDNNLGMDEGYFLKINPSNNAEYIKFDAVSFSGENPKASTTFITELNQRFLSEGYTFVENYYYLGYSSYPGKIYQDPKSEVYIALLKVGDWTVYIYTSDDIDYLENNIGGYSALQGAGNLQDYDGAENGKVVLVSHGYYNDDSLFSGVSATEEELEYDEPLDFEGAQTKTIYKINDYGFATTKYVIDKSSEDDGSYDYTSEVRLVRKTTPVKFHTNNPTIEDATARNNQLFRVYNPEDGKTYTVEDGTYDLTNYKVPEFYNIPTFAGDDYVFAGWYYDADGDKDGDIPFEFDSAVPAGVTDVYAHWIPVGEVAKEDGESGSVGGFELQGVQIRREAQFDQNLGEYYYGGLRFVTSISESLLSSVDALSDETVNGNKVEYGYVTAAKSTVDTVAGDDRFCSDVSKYKIQYKGENVNGVDTLLDNATSEQRATPNNYRYITNVDCTSKIGGYGGNARIKIDHQNYTHYRLATFVVTYQDKAEDMAKNVVARAYMRYYDANGLLRTFYIDYGGTNVYGGCSISYNDAHTLAGI